MHQGSGNNSNSERKREPIAHAINPGGVSQIGAHVGNNPESINAGRGFMAPSPVAETIHHCGSQGKHK